VGAGARLRLGRGDMCTAAKGGHLEVLIWAREHGCLWDETMYDVDTDCSSLAASGGHLEVLKWLRGHGYPMDEATCTLAAEGGHLEVLQWAREHG